MSFLFLQVFSCLMPTQQSTLSSMHIASQRSSRPTVKYGGASLYSLIVPMGMNKFVEQERTAMPITQRRVDQERQRPNTGGIILESNVVKVMWPFEDWISLCFSLFGNFFFFCLLNEILFPFCPTLNAVKCCKLSLIKTISWTSTGGCSRLTNTTAAVTH